MAYIKTAIPGRRQIMVRGQVGEPLTVATVMAMIGVAKLAGDKIGDMFGLWGQSHWTDFRREQMQILTSEGLGEYISSADMTNYAYGPIIRTTENKRFKEQTMDKDSKYRFVGQTAKTVGIFKVVTTWNYFSDFYLQRLIKNRVIAKAKTTCQSQGGTWTGKAPNFCTPGGGGGGGGGITTSGILGKGIAFMIAGTVVYMGYQFFTRHKEEEA